MSVVVMPVTGSVKVCVRVVSTPHGGPGDATVHGPAAMTLLTAATAAGSAPGGTLRLSGWKVIWKPRQRS